MDNSGFNNIDNFVIIDGIILFREDGAIYGCYRDRVEISKKDMLPEEHDRAAKAHLDYRKRTFDTVGEENKGG
jgi:hypothetical protein